MKPNKPKVIKHFDSLPAEIKAKFLEDFPYGHEDYLISFPNAKGELIRAVPYETEEFQYMIKFGSSEASNTKKVLDDDEDDDEDDDGDDDYDGIEDSETEEYESAEDEMD